MILLSKIRVYELAKELNVSSKNLINLLMEEFGVEVKNHMSVIEDEDATLIKELLGDTSSESEGKKSLVDEYEDELQMARSHSHAFPEFPASLLFHMHLPCSQDCAVPLFS